MPVISVTLSMFLEWPHRWLDEEPAGVPGHGGHGVGQRQVDGEGAGEEGGGEEGGGGRQAGRSSSWKGGF